MTSSSESVSSWNLSVDLPLACRLGRGSVESEDLMLFFGELEAVFFLGTSSSSEEDPPSNLFRAFSVACLFGRVPELSLLLVLCLPEPEAVSDPLGVIFLL